MIRNKNFLWTQINRFSFHNQLEFKILGSIFSSMKNNSTVSISQTKPIKVQSYFPFAWLVCGYSTDAKPTSDRSEFIYIFLLPHMKWPVCFIRFSSNCSAAFPLFHFIYLYKLFSYLSSWLWPSNLPIHPHVTLFASLLTSATTTLKIFHFSGVRALCRMTQVNDSIRFNASPLHCWATTAATVEWQ